MPMTDDEYGIAGGPAADDLDDLCGCGHKRSLHHPGGACFADDDCQCIEFGSAAAL